MGEFRPRYSCSPGYISFLCLFSNYISALTRFFYLIPCRTTDMGGRKFRVGEYRKNKERKQKHPSMPVIPLSLPISIPRQVADIQATNLVVSLPLTAFTASRQSSLGALHSRIGALTLPRQWVVASQQQGSHLTLCKLLTTQPPLFQASVSFSLTITDQFSWTLSIGQCRVEPAECPVLTSEPVAMDSAASILKVLLLLDSCKICIGNNEKQFLDVLTHRLTTSCGSSGKCIVVIDQRKYVNNFSFICLLVLLGVSVRGVVRTTTLMSKSF